MADQTIALKIPSEKAPIALEGYLTIYPNMETKDDPDWVDPEDGSTAPQITKYSGKQWIIEKVRRLLIRDIRRGLQMKANIAARVVEDDSLVKTI